jgi:hypothetical protein
MVTDDDDKMHMSTCNSVLYFLRGFGGNKVKTVNILEVGQMEESCVIFMGEVDRLVTVSLSTLITRTLIDFPGTSTIPYRPCSVLYCKFVLETLPQSPLD